MKEIKGSFIGKGRSFAIVVSSFNEMISKQLLQGCVDTLVRHSVAEEEITVVWATGSFEVPLLAKRLAASKKYSAVICLGAVIRGDTPHFDYIAAEVTKGIASVALAENIPVIYGMITADTQEQALERAGIKQGNKGKDAALSALEMSDVVAKIK